jgi:hypothetical protein
MMRSRWLLLATALSFSLPLGLAPSIARAETPAELKRARAQFQRGIELEQASNWSEAIQMFREVGQVRMTPHVRFHIAFCEEGLGRLVTALGGYELAFSEADQVGPDFKGEVETAIKNLKERIPKLVLERGAGAEAATVQLDGVDLGASSIGVEVPLDPGPHSVAAVAPGMKPFSTTADLREREVTRVVLELEAEPLPDKPPPPKQEVVVVTREEPPKRLVPYLIGGAGVAALLGAGALFVLKQTTQADLEDKCPDPNACDPAYKDTYNRMKFYGYAAPVAAGVGAAAVGVSVWMLFLRRPKQTPVKTTTSLTLTPGAPHGFAGATLSGEF